MAAQTAAEKRRELEAKGDFVSPSRGAVVETRAGSVEPPIGEADPSQAEYLARMADVLDGELTPVSQDDLDAAVIAAFHHEGVIKPKGLHAKLAEVMQVASRIPKNGRAPAAMGGYAFVQVGDAADPIRKALSERGVTMMPHDIQLIEDEEGSGPFVESTTSRGGTMTTVTIMTTWRLTDSETGEFYDLPSLGTGADSGDKFAPKAQTNAMKYALLMGFLLSTGDDPEAADLSESPQGPGINITGSNIEGVRQGGRQGKATEAQLDAIRKRAGELELTPESLAVLIGSTLGGKTPDIDSLETPSDQSRAILAFLGELTFDEAGAVTKAILGVPTA